MLDLRFNPGGMLNEAIQVSDLFAREGKIVSIAGRSTDKRTWDAREAGTLIPQGFPLAVIVNRFSASAAEIVSACLQDHEIAVVIGERTWGKRQRAEHHRVRGRQERAQTDHRRIPTAQRQETFIVRRARRMRMNGGWTPDDGYTIRYDNTGMMNLGIRFTQLDALTLQRGGEEVDDSGFDFVDTQLEKGPGVPPRPHSSRRRAAAGEGSTGRG